MLQFCRNRKINKLNLQLVNPNFETTHLKYLFSISKVKLNT